jgi:cystathionine beta-lyase
MHPRPTALPGVFAERMKARFGWQVDPRRVELLTDVVQGLYVALQVYAGEGDGAVIQPPIYPPFYEAVRETGRREVSNPLRLGEGGFELDLDGLRRAIDARTRVLLFCNPHNPGGRVFTRSELQALLAIAEEHDLVVVSDEIHQDLVYSGHRHVPFASLGPEAEARSVTLTSATKAFNIAGLRCAVAVFGSDELKRRFLAVPRHTRGGLSGLGIAATLAAWRHAQPWQDEVMAYLEGNRRFVGQFLKEHLPGVRCHLPEATYLAWLDCRELDLGQDPQAFFLERARVALSAGPSFGAAWQGFARLNFATARPILTEVLERMAAALK